MTESQQLFRVTEPETDVRANHVYSVDATSRWSLPGVRCGNFGHSVVGVSYPTVDLSGVPDAKRKFRSGVVDKHEWKALCQSIAPIVGDRLLVPGTSLGPYEGSATGDWGDVVWPVPWTVLLSSKVVEKFAEARIETPFQRAELKTRIPQAVLWEPELNPAGEIVLASEPEKCADCGTLIGPKVTDVWRIDRDSSPRLDFFRLRMLPTVIVASERVRQIAEDLALTELAFTEI